MIRPLALLACLAGLAGTQALGQETIVIDPPDAPEQDSAAAETAPAEPAPPPVIEAASAPGGVVRVLDKSSGRVTDLDLPAGETGSVGSLAVTLLDCRYAVANPAGDAFILLSIRYRDPEPLFLGWMIASAPAVSAMDHPRYDVWALRCNIP